MRRDPWPVSIAWVPAPGAEAPPHRALCTDCGISRSSEPGRCARACQFIRPDYAARERAAHGREREASRPDELHFGVHRRLLRGQLTQPRDGAQWSGLTTRIAERLLEAGRVQAVLTMGRDARDRPALRSGLLPPRGRPPGCPGTGSAPAARCDTVGWHAGSAG